MLCMLLSAFAISCSPVSANQWKVAILPATLNKDNTIRLVGNEVQVLSLVLQADKDVTSQAKTHDITLEFDMPAGMNVMQNAGSYQFQLISQQTQNGRSITNYKVNVPNSSIMGAPGSRILSEGKNQTLFVNTTKSVPPGQNSIHIKLQDGTATQTFDWPLEISTLTAPAQRPKHTSIGLWDYTYGRATDAKAAAGMAKFLHDSGISFVQKAADPVYLKAMQNQGIITGGYTHHDYFFDKAYPDYNAAGKAATGGYADPQSIIALPQNAVIPGVKQLVDNAKIGDGIATFDYEPRGTTGFSPAAIAKFKQEYNVSSVDFQKFQEYVAKDGSKTSQTTDPLIAKIWRQWVEFRSTQTSNYVRRISEAVKAQAPETRILVTPSASAGKKSKKTLALGVDSAAMAKYVDIIMPQIYSGYGAANAKLVMQMTESWHQEIQQQQAKTQLWPLLLVRYSGATVGNSPVRLRQQIIGSLAHGADGVGFYYPVNMDAPYWEMIARTSEDIAKYENYYQDGNRVDEQFPLSGMPTGSVQLPMYPNYNETVKNPNWDFTAHELAGKVLLTLMNLEEANDLVFDINIGNAKVLSTQNTEKSGNHQWLIAPGQIGFVVLQR